MTLTNQSNNIEYVWEPPPMNDTDKSRIIEMAWQDRIPFEAIKRCYGLSEPEVIRLMRANLKASSFKLWRKRVSGRKTKHTQLSNKTTQKNMIKARL